MVTPYYKQTFAICNSNPFLAGRGNLLLMKTAREIVAENLEALMAGRKDLNTQQKVAAKAGLRQRTIGYMLNPASTDMKSPKLNSVEKVAGAFGIPPWQLLVDRDSFGEELGEAMLRPPTPDKRLEELGSQTPTGNKPPAVRGKRGKKRSLV